MVEGSGFCADYPAPHPSIPGCNPPLRMLRYLPQSEMHFAILVDLLTAWHNAAFHFAARPSIVIFAAFDADEATEMCSCACNMIKISYIRLRLVHNVLDFTNLIITPAAMTDLLTTKQVQTLLRVDRTTIYRMVEGGQLPAIRVGKQWRFSRTDVERWLQVGWHAARSAAPVENEPAPHTAPAAAPSGQALSQTLPLDCAQAIQDAFADMLGVTMVITDMQGQPVTRISNPCGFFTTLMAENPDGLQHCVRTWQQMAGHVALEPKFLPNEMGLMCARGLIRVGAELKGMVVVGGIASEGWPPGPQHAAELADLFGVSPETVAANSDAVFRMDRPAQERTLRFVQRMADVFSQMVQDRLAMVTH